MKKAINNLEKDWMVFIYGIIGILLIIFPNEFAVAIPFMLGLGLILRGIVSIISVFKYKNDSNKAIGRIIINIVLGGAILYHNADAIGAIGSIWAMISLQEVAEEITEAHENKHFSWIRVVFAVITVILAVMLLFDPFEHFTFHVRILGLEMLSSVFVKSHKILRSKTEKQQA